MDEPALGCAQNVDGTLRDASQINWFNDHDHKLPASGPDASSSQLHPFFTGAAKPVGKIAGVCRSSRTTRPSSRMIDPNNAESSVSADLPADNNNTSYNNTNNKMNNGYYPHASFKAALALFVAASLVWLRSQAKLLASRSGSYTAQGWFGQAWRQSPRALFPTWTCRALAWLAQSALMLGLPDVGLPALRQDFRIARLL
ncbi:hypothetical protein C8J57DRAFT_1510884 [Mycena rebaudengoi]|nr:hypothetical protein C8J57DRAFT_1510884 [Mycena rebaudengoi]